jgi:hypothetical protein
MVPEGERPHPGRSYGRGLENASDHEAIGEHVEVVVIPFTGGRLALACLRSSTATTVWPYGSRLRGRRPVRGDARPNTTAPLAHKAKTDGSDHSFIWKMADVHGSAVIAKAGVAMNQQVAAATGSHVT